MLFRSPPATSLTGAARSSLTALQSRWLGSIHLHMLSSPLRKCIVTSKVLPTSLMLQLKPVRLAPTLSTSASDKYSSAGLSSKASQPSGAAERIVVLPNAILHPKYSPRKTGTGTWITLDARVFAHLRQKASYKRVDSKAVLAAQIEDLVWWQLGERCIQELHELVDRFGTSRRLDLFARPDDDTLLQPRRWQIRLQTQTKDVRVESHVFQPSFQDAHQSQRFQQAIQDLLAPTPEMHELACVYTVKHSHITAPLGIALYRLNLWVSNAAPPMPRTPQLKQPKSELS